MIDENLSTALFMESDVDWDMRIKDSLPELAKGVKQIADDPRPFDPQHTTSVDLTPYGSNWDILHLGHCGSGPFPGSGRNYAFNDTSIPPYGHEWALCDKPTDLQRPNGTRIVYEPERTICLYAYALSRKGALKLKEIVFAKPGAIDLVVSTACKDDASLRCVSVFPQVISDSPSFSNISPVGENEKKEADGSGHGITCSAKVNAQAVLDGAARENWKGACR